MNTSWCMFCRHQIETPLGKMDLANHWLDVHRDELLRRQRSMTLVGEPGPELTNLGKGRRVFRK